MNAKLSPHSARRGRPWAVRPWTLAVLGVLLVTGALIQACTDNNGPAGPSFECHESTTGGKTTTTRSGNVRSLAACTATPVPVTGDGIGGPSATIFVSVAVNPGTIEKGRRGTVLVSVTNQHGFAIANTAVQLASAGGNLDATSGTTDGNGLFSTTIFVPCDSTGAGKVTAIVSGVTGTGAFTAVTATENNPCPPPAAP